MSKTQEYADPGTEQHLRFARQRLAALSLIRSDLKLPAMAKSYRVDASTLVQVKSTEFGDWIRITGGTPQAYIFEKGQVYVDGSGGDQRLHYAPDTQPYVYGISGNGETILLATIDGFDYSSPPSGTQTVRITPIKGAVRQEEFINVTVDAALGIPLGNAQTAMMSYDGTKAVIPISYDNSGGDPIDATFVIYDETVDPKFRTLQITSSATFGFWIVSSIASSPDLSKWCIAEGDVSPGGELNIIEVTNLDTVNTITFSNGGVNSMFGATYTLDNTLVVVYNDQLDPFESLTISVGGVSSTHTLTAGGLATRLDNHVMSADGQLLYIIDANGQAFKLDHGVFSAVSMYPSSVSGDGTTVLRTNDAITHLIVERNGTTYDLPSTGSGQLSYDGTVVEETSFGGTRSTYTLNEDETEYELTGTVTIVDGLATTQRDMKYNKLKPN